MAYKTALEEFDLTKVFPKEEKYALVDQIRRSSRSVAANIAEAWHKRRYIKAFVNRLVDASGEAGETEVWLNFARDHGYLSSEHHEQFLEKYDEIQRLLTGMINKPEKFCQGG